MVFLAHTSSPAPRFRKLPRLRCVRSQPIRPSQPRDTPLGRLFSNHNSIIIGIKTLFPYVVVYWAIFLPHVYFQSVTLTSPTKAGINVIPVVLHGVHATTAAALCRCGLYK